MHHSAEPDFLGQLDTIFAQLNPQDVEQFYSAYKQWLLQQQIASLQRRILHVQQQLADNAQRIQQTQPSPIALATLARLQSNGVNDIDLLDSMLARGEAWLDATMQRLDYCEQIDDFISDNYTQWCRLALEGAFDWIDSIGDEASPTSSGTEEAPSMVADTVNANTEATEALLLQKLTSESDEQEDLSWQEETLKQAAIKLASQVEDSSISESELTEQSTRVEVAAPEEVVIAEETGSPEPAPSEYVEVEEPEQLEEPGPSMVERQPAVEPEIEDSPEMADNEGRSANQGESDNQVDALNRVPTNELTQRAHAEMPINQVDALNPVPTRPPKRSIMQRLIGKLLGE